MSTNPSDTIDTAAATTMTSAWEPTSTTSTPASKLDSFTMYRRQPQGRRGYKRQIRLGPYLLLQTLGEGEFGKVKLGIHIETGQEFAIKLIRKETVGFSASRLSKVEREIHALKTLKHPNIVKLFNVVETEKYIGIILEYASGGELFEYILAHRSLKEKDARRLFAQLVSSVQYMHRKKVVHRDLKLENLLLDRNRNIIVTDFGFANQFGSKEDDLMATSCGSPCYAAPELVVNDGLYAGSAVDIWSCGVILYAMLCGYLPFDDDPSNPDGNNINLLYRYILSTPPAFPKHISPDARDLLRQMLVADPAKRCSLENIQTHPWLEPYQYLFNKSDSELEVEAATAAEQSFIPSYRKIVWPNLRLRGDDDANNVSHDKNKSNVLAPAVAAAAAAAITTSGNKENVAVLSENSASSSRPVTVHGALTLRRLTLGKAAAERLKSDRARKTRTTLITKKDHDTRPGHQQQQGASPPQHHPPRRERLLSFFTGKPVSQPPVKKYEAMDTDETEAKSSEQARATSSAAGGSCTTGTSSMSTSCDAPASKLRSKFIASLRARRREPPRQEGQAIRDYLQSGSMSATVGATNAAGMPVAAGLNRAGSPPTSKPGPNGASVHPDLRRQESLEALIEQKEYEKDMNSEPSSKVVPEAVVTSLGVQSGRKAVAAVRNSIHRNKKAGTVRSTNDWIVNNEQDPSEPHISPGIGGHGAPSDHSSHQQPQQASHTGRNKVMAWIRRKSGGKDNKDTDAALPPTPVSPGDSSPISPPSGLSHESSAPRTVSGGLLPLSPPVSPSNDPNDDSESKLRVHHGAVDRAALTSRPPAELMLDVAQTLRALGIHVKSDGPYKLKCSRRQAKHRAPKQESSPCNNGGSSGSASCDSLSGEEVDTEQQQPKEDMYQDGVPSTDNIAADRCAPSMLFPNPGRLSDCSSVHPADNEEDMEVDEHDNDTTPPTSRSLVSVSTHTTGPFPVQPSTMEPIYGDPSIDAGEEIRFAVEVCRFRNLPCLFIVDVRRLRGSVWAYKFLYHKLFDLLNLSKTGYIRNTQNNNEKALHKEQYL